MNEKYLIKALDKDPFFHYYFNENLYYYLETKFRINNISHNLLLNKSVDIQSVGITTVFENGDKQLNIDQRIAKKSLEALQEKMRQQHGECIIRTKMNNFYLIAVKYISKR